MGGGQLACARQTGTSYPRGPVPGQAGPAQSQSSATRCTPALACVKAHSQKGRGKPRHGAAIHPSIHPFIPTWPDMRVVIDAFAWKRERPDAC